MVRKFRGVTIVLLCLGLLSCARPPDLVGVDNRDIPVFGVEDAHRHRIFVATTREPSDQPAVLYSGARGWELGLSSVVVSVPPDHMSGVIERARQLPPDPTREFAIVSPEIYGSRVTFAGALDAELARRPPKDRDILLFVHGYNNTFSDAVLRMAQFVNDTGFRGVPVLFSWASAGRPSHYVYDLNSALAARSRFQDTLRLLAASRAQGINIFAHSMGSLLTVEALIQTKQRVWASGVGKVNHVVLAAPDIDLDLFETQLSQIRTQGQDFYVFVSNDDPVLGMSRRLSGGVARVGAADVDKLAKLGVTVIDLSEIEDSASGSHNKFAASPEVVQMIGTGLSRSTLDPQRGLASLSEALNQVPVVRVAGPEQASGR
ncbi:alpha/beta hydrolase [Rhodobacteraceae bacterium F11138]|nr:alpha/beta hydrolase [Rhodobacteraceae bacterium F11138]